MKIVDIRNTSSFGWVIDIQENILPYSISLCVPMAEMNDDELFVMLSEYANNDHEHINYGKPKCSKVIVTKSFAERWTNNTKDYRSYYHTNQVEVG